MASILPAARRVYGIDFSGAKDAGRKIWVAVGSVQHGVLCIGDCRPAAEFLGTKANREICLAALRQFIAGQKEVIFALDFPFGLPRALTHAKSWAQFVHDFPRRYASAGEFREACLRAAERKELRRCTDKTSRTPFSPYNLRLYRQTFYGIANLLSPLVREDQACVLPMQKPTRGKPWLIEICPASWLRKKGLIGISYKGRSKAHWDGRRQLVGALLRQPGLLIASHVQEIALENKGGDALDSLIAAYAAFGAISSNPLKPCDYSADFSIEGYVYF